MTTLPWAATGGRRGCRALVSKDAAVERLCSGPPITSHRSPEPGTRRERLDRRPIAGTKVDGRFAVGPATRRALRIAPRRPQAETHSSQQACICSTLRRSTLIIDEYDSALPAWVVALTRPKPGLL